MNTLKGWISTTFLVVTLSFATASAHAGIIVGNFSNDEKLPCTEATVKLDWGNLVSNVTGIIVGNLTGIIVGNAVGVPTPECGIDIRS